MNRNLVRKQTAPAMDIDVQFISTEDPQWNAFLQGCPHDYFHLPEHTRLIASHEGGEGVGVLMSNAENAMLLPLILQPIPGRLEAQAGWHDAFSPYGYSGMLLANQDRLDLLPEFAAALHENARLRQIVSVFVRLHPLIGPPSKLLTCFGHLVCHGKIVYINLRLGRDRLVANIRKSHRQNIARLEQFGYRVVINDWTHLDAFVDIYRQTMQRKSADDYYFFSREFFSQLRALGEVGITNLFVVLAPDDSVASGSIITTVDSAANYFLTGTATDQLAISPSKLLLREAIDWSAKIGCSFMLLGGGLSAREDHLYQFKKGFSDLVEPFCTLRMVTDPERYGLLNSRRRALNEERAEEDVDFFPAYRA